MEEQEAEIRLAAKRCANTSMHIARETNDARFSLLAIPQTLRDFPAADLKMGANNVSVVFTSDRSAPIFNEQTEREGLHKEEVTITKKARERG